MLTINRRFLWSDMEMCLARYKVLALSFDYNRVIFKMKQRLVGNTRLALRNNSASFIPSTRMRKAHFSHSCSGILFSLHNAAPTEEGKEKTMKKKSSRRQKERKQQRRREKEGGKENIKTRRKKSSVSCNYWSFWSRFLSLV